MLPFTKELCVLQNPRKANCLFHILQSDYCYLDYEYGKFCLPILNCIHCLQWCYVKVLGWLLVTIHIHFCCWNIEAFCLKINLSYYVTVLMGQIEDLVIKALLSVELHVANACKMFIPYRTNCFGKAHVDMYGVCVCFNSVFYFSFPWSHSH